MRKAKGNIRKMLAAIVLTLLCCSAFAQRIVESGDLRTTTDEQHGTVVHYLKGGKRPLSGKFRILRGQDEEIVHFSKGVMQGEYRRFRNGSLREKGKYTRRQTAWSVRFLSSERKDTATGSTHAVREDRRYGKDMVQRREAGHGSGI